MSVSPYCFWLDDTVDEIGEAEVKWWQGNLQALMS